MVEAFTWIDGERLVRFGTGVLGEAPELLARRGFEGYALLTTERAETFGAGLASGAASVAHVPSGSVPDAAAAVRAAVDRRPVVTFGGGRVVDVGKAIAGTFGLPCAALPTTLAGSPMTPFHRMPAGTSGGALIRPSLVVWDPSLHATLPRGQLVATALNSLAHAFESLYTPLVNPVGELAALRATRLLARELPRAEPDREAVALGSLLGGYAIGMSGLAVHHALCQTVVRRADLPHAETNALVLPHTVAFMANRAPVEVDRFARALDAAGDGEPSRASASVARLAAETGLSGLAELGLERDAIGELAQATTQHPALANTPGGAPSQDDLAAILHAAL